MPGASCPNNVGPNTMDRFWAVMLFCAECCVILWYIFGSGTVHLRWEKVKMTAPVEMPHQKLECSIVGVWQIVYAFVHSDMSKSLDLNFWFSNKREKLREISAHKSRDPNTRRPKNGHVLAASINPW